MATKKSKTYHELQAELDAVLQELQSSELDIDKVLTLYRQGEAVLAELDNYLTHAKNEIEQLKQ
jgi:exodeoxyribonuclease VII small subunit